jgi:RNA recognition motif-containing protein
VEIVYNRNTHKSKGYGFIEMGSIDEAKRAVEVLHDQPFMGREMIVNGAKSKGPADDDSEE